MVFLILNKTSLFDIDDITYALSNLSIKRPLSQGEFDSEEDLKKHPYKKIDTRFVNFHILFF